MFGDILVMRLSYEAAWRALSVRPFVCSYICLLRALHLKKNVQKQPG